jgi:hypothetical protein
VRARLLFVTTLVLAASPAWGQSYRDDLAVPPYPLFQSMIAEVQEGNPSQKMEEPLAAIRPLIEALDKHYGTHTGADLDRAVRAGDRDASRRALVTLVLLDSQDLVDRVRKDDLSEWQDARVATRKALLDFELVQPLLKGPDPAITSDFKALAKALQDADWETTDDSVQRIVRAVSADLARARLATGEEK